MVAQLINQIKKNANFNQAYSTSYFVSVVFAYNLVTVIFGVKQRQNFL